MSSDAYRCRTSEAPPHLVFDSEALGLPGYVDGQIEDGTAVIYDVGVVDGQHRMGVGTNLVRAFEKWAAEAGATCVEGASMIGAIDFWEKLGYEVGDLDDEDYAPLHKDLLATRYHP